MPRCSPMLAYGIKRAAARNNARRLLVIYAYDNALAWASYKARLVSLLGDLFRPYVMPNARFNAEIVLNK